MDLIILTLQEILDDDDVEIVGDVITEEDFRNNVKINGQAPLMSWMEFQIKMEEVRGLQTFKRLREERDLLLQQSDRYVLPDYPNASDGWLTYRQALRDLPATINPETGLEGVVWPVKPE